MRASPASNCAPRKVVSSSPACSDRSWSTRARTSVAVTMCASPCVRLRRRAAGAREDLVETLHRVGIELDLECTHRAVDLLDRAWADDGRGDDRVGEEPRERNVGRRVTELGAELLPLLELRAHGLDAILDVLVAATTTGGAVGEHAAEQPTTERAPRDHADAVVLARGEHFELDGAGVEVVEALLRHEAERPSPLGGFVRLHDVPAGEVAAAHVEHFALLYEDVHRLPDLVPRRVAVDVMHLVEVDVV